MDNGATEMIQFIKNVYLLYKWKAPADLKRRYILAGLMYWSLLALWLIPAAPILALLWVCAVLGEFAEWMGGHLGTFFGWIAPLKAENRYDAATRKCKEWRNATKPKLYTRVER